MSFEPNAAPAADAGATASNPIPAIPADGPLNIRQATDGLLRRREEAAKAAAPANPDTSPQKARAPDGKFAPAAHESAPAAEPDAAPDDNPLSGETNPADEPAADELPPIEPPASWSKDAKDRFAALPRDAQETIADRERVRDAELRRGQNEVAEQRKAIEAERQAAEKARQQYEQALPHLLQTLQNQQAGEFADIKSHEDVRKLAEDDPFRFARFQAAQMQLARVQDEVRATQQRQQEDAQRQFSDWASEQDKKFAEQFRDFADAEKAPRARESVVNYLTEVRGVSRDQLPALWSNPVFRDARMQAIVYDAARFHAAQQKAKAAATAPKPPVQRPGTAPAKGDAQSATIAALQQKLDKATRPNEQIAAAAALRAAKRAAR